MIDGEQQMGEILSSEDKNQYKKIKSTGNKEDMDNLKNELVAKYFKEQLENNRENNDGESEWNNN